MLQTYIVDHIRHLNNFSESIQENKQSTDTKNREKNIKSNSITRSIIENFYYFILGDGNRLWFVRL